MSPTLGPSRVLAAAKNDSGATKNSERWLRLLLRQVPAVLWTTDRDFRFTSSTGAGLKQLGLKPDEAVGLSLAEYFGDPDHIAIRAHERALEGASSSYEAEWEGRVYETHIEPFRNERGEVTGIVGIALDITGRRRAEEELAEQTAYFTRLFEDAPEGIVLLDENDVVLRTNREFTRMFGYTAKEAVGRRINDLVVPAERAREASSLSRRIAAGESVSVEAVRRRKDGSTIHVSILGTPIELREGLHIYGIYRDVTERKKLENRLIRSQKMEAVGRLAAGVAHDFNNLLTAIIGHTRMLLGEIDDPELRADAREIERSAERAAELTHQLLTFGRKDAGEPRALNLNRVVLEMERLLRGLIGEDVEMETTLAPDLPSIEGDPAQLEQVVMNLAVNARDALPSGGRLEIATGAIGPEENEDPATGRTRYVVLTVRDTGEGMSAEERARMFEPFYTTKPPGKGTGLGLATVYGVVEGMNGHIEVDSLPGQGTTVRVHFPAVETTRSEPVRRAKTEEEPGPGHETILLVEDEPSVRRMAQRVLENQGYAVIPAADGEEALELVERAEGEIHFLLSDVVMPGMSGHELGSRLRASMPDLRAIFMSGYTDRPSVPEEFAEDEAEFLPKPFSPDTLARKVREVLSR